MSLDGCLMTFLEGSRLEQGLTQCGGEGDCIASNDTV